MQQTREAVSACIFCRVDVKRGTNLPNGQGVRSGGDSKSSEGRVPRLQRGLASGLPCRWPGFIGLSEFQSERKLCHNHLDDTSYAFCSFVKL